MTIPEEAMIGLLPHGLVEPLVWKVGFALVAARDVEMWTVVKAAVSEQVVEVGDVLLLNPHLFSGCDGLSE